MKTIGPRICCTYFALAVVPACGLILPLPEPHLEDESTSSGGSLGGEGGISDDKIIDTFSDDNLGGQGSTPSVGLGGATQVGSGGSKEAGSGGKSTQSAGGTENEGSGGQTAPSSGGTCASCECEDPCDCDEDGVEASNCGGLDCDDRDARAFPEQTVFFSERSDNHAVGFDYNCSDAIERPAAYEVVNCDAVSLVDCEGKQGFLGEVPSCGSAGSWGKCSKTLLGCEESEVDSDRVVLCH